MRGMIRQSRLLFFTICIVLASSALAAPNEFSFAVIQHPSKIATNEAALLNAIAETDADNLAFVVANGIKSGTEPCSDKIYERRKALLEGAKNGLIVSVTGNDWSSCRYGSGRSSAVERLNRLRDLFFTGEFSLGASKIPVVRQSSSPRFRSYGENTRWEIANIIFSTINLPADNNHYLTAAGRNSEFDDRLIANRDWLQRTFTLAMRKKSRGIVIFSDGDPFAPVTAASAKRDGFTEIRQKITALASKFNGKVLIVDAQPQSVATRSSRITWRANLGSVHSGADWVKLKVIPGSALLFTVDTDTVEAKNGVQ